MVERWQVNVLNDLKKLKTNIFDGLMAIFRGFGVDASALQHFVDQHLKKMK